jgi:hypothetical protein
MFSGKSWNMDALAGCHANVVMVSDSFDWGTRGMPVLAPEKRRSLARKVRKLLGKNYNDEEILHELGIKNPLRLQKAKAMIMEQDRMLFERLHNDVVYSDYLMKQGKLIRELSDMAVKFRNRGQWGALVASAKVRSDIYDKMVKLGQELGFIQKKATELNISAKMQFGAMSDAQVMKELHKEVNDLNALVQKSSISMRKELLDATGIPTFVSEFGQRALPAPNDDDSKTVFVKSKLKAKKAEVKVTLKRRG